MTTITFIGYGEAGGILADALAKENPVTVWDCKLNGPERDAMMTKANRGGVRAASSLADALTGAELIFSTVTAGSALDVASQAAPLMTDTQYFLDLNSVAPQTKRQAAERFKPGAYVDVAVMAPVPPGALRTPLLTGGPQAKAIAELLTALGCHARYGGDEVGSVSAIKMCRSVMIKGLEALTAECLFAARQYGVEEAVLASLHASFPSLGWNEAFPDYLISRVAEHGIRRSEEMEEVVKTLRDVAGEGVMSQATAKAQRHLPDRLAAQGITYAQLEPFDWKALAALLKGQVQTY
ncbi:TPA: NAD(P)-dependent oxidoreductase [Klebsiella oxytoca]|nr:NAD(P)-dependent oxidoreductase [Klebsiella oxytoca]